MQSVQIHQQIHHHHKQTDTFLRAVPERSTRRAADITSMHRVLFFVEVKEKTTTL